MDYLWSRLTRKPLHSQNGDVEELPRKLSSASTYVLPKRRIYVNMELPVSELNTSDKPRMNFVTNKIRTAKYTIFNFLPKNLFEQFRKVANLYFLFLVLLQSIPAVGGGVTPLVSAAPLASIMSFTALKDAFEDWKRRQQDNSLNRSITLRLTEWNNVNLTGASRNRPKFFRRQFNRIMGVWGFPSKKKIIDSGKTVAQQDALDYNSQSNRGSSVGSPIYQRVEHSQTSLKSHPDIPTIIINQSQVDSTAKWSNSRWQDLRVGDLVKLKNNESVPADIIILSTSEPDGLCYVETKNLDGETNLKVRHAVSATSYLVTEQDCELVTFYVESEPPHPNLYSYTGALHFTGRTNGIINNPPPNTTTITFDNNGQSEIESPQQNQRTNPTTEGIHKIEPISINDVLLRGCLLRNTEWIIGLVAFTGTDTKIMLNSGDTPSKRSRIEIETNFHVTMNFIILFCLCLGSSIADAIYYVQPTSSADFFEFDDGNNGKYSAAKSAFITFWVCLIIFQNIVPISLYITIEMVKTVQAYFIHSDLDMYYEKLDYPCTPKTWNISDDLGQIEYIFSDKTGTLTQNVMEFRKCTINGIAYGIGETDTTRGSKMQQQLDSGSPIQDDQELNVEIEREKQLMLEEMGKLFDNRYISPNLTFIDSKLFKDLKLQNQQSRAIQDFFSALALCHTVLAERPDPNNSFLIDYKAQSPDEAALVGAARDVGFVFVDRFQDKLVIEVMGEKKEFTLLNVLEFNSTRKRMSVLVRQPEGGVILLCKGADSVIYERLEKGRQTELKEETLAHLEAFANEGLRTLCIAYRTISEEEFTTWSEQYAEAASSINDREEKIEQACDLIEHSFILMGGTAIEDRLQEGVPECIATLAQAGIKLWVLTGDKIETAINIGFACNLLQKDMQLIIVSATDKLSTDRQLKEALNKFFGSDVEKTSGKHALIIDGETLKYALDKSLKDSLLQLGKQCQSVVCCRVSPLQKAKVVEMVKNGLNVMTLSIGDGANDVSMIQEANIGIGIAGEEGRQAVMASDYAFAQFRYLTKLLLVHGRWSYIRVAEMITCFFYKNIVWTIAMFWFQIYAGFTAQYLYDYTFILLYNLVFTAFPVMYLGAFDQDVDAKTSLKNPALYKRGILQQDFKNSKFWLYVLDAIYQSAVCFFVPYGLMQSGQSHANGLENNSLQDLGTLVAGSVIATTNLYVGLNTLNWTWLAFVVIGLSILSFYAWAALYSIIASVGFFRVDQILYSEFDFWLAISLSVVVSILPRFTVKYLHKTYWPTDTDIVREQVRIAKKSSSRKRSRSVKEEDQVPIALRKLDGITDTSGVSTSRHDRSDSDASLGVTPVTLTTPTVPSKKERSIKQISRILSGKDRTASIRSEEQMFFMGSGKRQSFTGFAFSGEESGFESFRQSVYRPVQNRIELNRTQSLADPTSRSSRFLASLSIGRSRTLPSSLFRRRVGDPSSSQTSPSHSNNPSGISESEGGNGNSRRPGNTLGVSETDDSEDVELSIMSKSSS
ncbi:hypothetical protein G9A89_013014 [Geosiphon pyriformis]|nr:hypothetical protein G9A89_013014 [Geosiphon pyriformis]